MDEHDTPNGPDEAGRDAAASPARQADGRAAATPDVERLAEKVYQMLRDEVRQARARGAARATPWGR